MVLSGVEPGKQRTLVQQAIVVASTLGAHQLKLFL
jgi:hypothetical protein